MENTQAIQLKSELDVTEVTAQVQKIQTIMKAVMKVNEHYGIIPGTKKPTLLKPGAEKLCLTFRLAPQYESTEHYDGNHLTVKSHCTLTHIPTGLVMGSGEGCCSTKESKYAYRENQRVCPTCGKEAIIKGKKEYGGGWLCFAKKGGCGAKFTENDETITSQPIGRVPNPDLPDQYNTILKMSNKRSLVAAVLNATAASDIFTQDLEEQLPPDGQTEAKGTEKANVIFDKKGDVVIEHETDEEEPKNGKALTEPQLKRLFAISKQHGWKDEEVKELLKTRFGGVSSKNLTRQQYDTLCQLLESEPAPNKKVTA